MPPSRCRLEFPAAGRALAALSVRPFAMRRLSAGLSLPLLTSVCLLLFALHFAVAEARTWHREGRWRVLQPKAWARWLLVALTAATALVRLAQLGAADRQWTRFVRGRPRRFTSFDQVAQLSSAARGLAASLLFLLLVKAAQQLRFVRQWSVFGKTLCRALPELLGVTLGLVVLGVAYAQLAVLLVSSCVDSLWSVAQALLVLCLGPGSLPCVLPSPGTCHPCCVWGSGRCGCGAPYGWGLLFSAGATTPCVESCTGRPGSPRTTRWWSCSCAGCASGWASARSRSSATKSALKGWSRCPPAPPGAPRYPRMCPHPALAPMPHTPPPPPASWMG
ncbi:polycystin-1-like isoform X2 [Nomascus leucogenys]|uniref:polycystin-1-like isoform X2 n=1 Tax=Nomascus leucogenys TaxID=61853 RepID=UPI00122DBBF0|nr:polycystin-1-like isoform X2 [Nomascus leucogenys]